MVTRIIDYTTGRPQYVWLKSCCLNSILTSAGVPQGNVLLPFASPSILHTSSYVLLPQTFFLAVSTIVACITDGQEDEYKRAVDNFVQWCELNYCILN